MYLDVVDLRDFYASPLGVIVERSLTETIRRIARVGPNSRILGFGFATPYLGAFRKDAERVLAFMPAGQGVIDWPAEGGSATALVDEDSLPLPDASVDCVLLVHALEMSPRPHELMAEVRRILVAGGTLVAVVPNRQGAWARSDVSPFGFGRPYSRGQLRSLFTDAGFQAEAWTTALHMPPSHRRPLLGAAPALDRIGRAIWPAFSGIITVRAAKRTVQGVRVRRLSPSLAFRPALRPNAGVLGRSSS